MGEMSEEGGWERTDFIICQHSYKLGYPNTSARPQLQTFFEYLVLLCQSGAISAKNQNIFLLEKIYENEAVKFPENAVNVSC